MTFYKPCASGSRDQKVIRLGVSRRTLTVATLVAAIGAFGGTGDVLAVDDMCKDATAESAAAELARNSQSKILRVLIRVKMADAQNRAAIDRETRAVADMIKQGGAYLAEPIHGQPLVVAEVSKEHLLDVAKDRRIVCITADRADEPHRY